MNRNFKRRKAFMGITKGKFFSAEDISLFCTQVSLVIKSAIPLSDGIAAIQDNVSEGEGANAVSIIVSALNNNKPFCEALKAAKCFPKYMIGMVEIGERTGNLEDVMISLADHYSREDKLKKNMKSAITYPMVLFAMMSVVLLVIIVKVLPIFNRVFMDLGSQMSPFATFMMNFGSWLGWGMFIVTILLTVFIVILFSKTGKTDANSEIETLLSQFGPTKKLAQKISAMRFASVLSMALSSGTGIDEFFKIIPNIIENESMKDKIKRCGEKINKGEPLAKAVEDEKFFPGLYGRMVSIGEKTGSLDSVMKKLADTYEEDIDGSIAKIVGIIEPVIVGVLSLIIGAILLSVMMPLLGIMSSL